MKYSAGIMYKRCRDEKSCEFSPNKEMNHLLFGEKRIFAAGEKKLNLQISP